MTARVFAALTLLACAASAEASVEVSSAGPDFGVIDLNPAGDTVIIAAENGAVEPSAARSVVTGGSSGYLSFTADEPTKISITYPSVSVALKYQDPYNGTHYIYVKNIRQHSQYASSSFKVPGDGSVVTVYFGGTLELDGTQTEMGAYSGTMNITLTYY
jgi:hypothetical protein